MILDDVGDDESPSTYRYYRNAFAKQYTILRGEEPYGTGEGLDGRVMRRTRHNCRGRKGKGRQGGIRQDMLIGALA